jgi:nitroreductase
MKILSAIRNHKSVRGYSGKRIPKNIINKILEAGIWGPSIHHFQPWKFIVINNSKMIEKIRELVSKNLRKMNIPGFMLYPTLSSFSTATTLMLVYNTRDFTNAVERFNKKIFRKMKIAEISATAAAIQNMLLTADSLGVGSCWLDAPLFCKTKIDKIIGLDHKQGELVATLTFGYAITKTKRASRKPRAQAVSFLE